MKNRTHGKYAYLLIVGLMVITAITAMLFCGCGNETPTTDATPAAAVGGAAPPAVPPTGAVAGGGVGQRINK